MLPKLFGERTIQAKVREQPDGTYLISVGNSVMKFFGAEDALGLRIRLEGIATIIWCSLTASTWSLWGTP